MRKLGRYESKECFIIALRIALISGYFFEGRGYQENLWAEQLYSVGHKVCVFASSYGHQIKSVDSSYTDVIGYEISRLGALRLPSGIILTLELGEKLFRYKPDLIFWIGVGQFFGYSLLCNRRLEHIPVVSFFGENLGWHEFDWQKTGIGLKQRMKALGFYLLRGAYYRRVFQRSRLVVATKLQTTDILTSLCRSEKNRVSLKNKTVELPLGYDPNIFCQNEESRKEIRKIHNISENHTLIVVSSRFSIGKRIDRIVEALYGALANNNRMRVCLIGFIDNDKVSESINRQIDTSVYRDRFIRLPFMNRKNLSMWYNASDIGLFHNPSISVQEAMGTGLYMCLSNDGSMSHLIDSSEQGLFFDRNNGHDIIRVLQEASKQIDRRKFDGYTEWRANICRKNAWLGYDFLLKRLMDRLFDISMNHNACSVKE